MYHDRIPEGPQLPNWLLILLAGLATVFGLNWVTEGSLSFSSDGQLPCEEAEQ